MNTPNRTALEVGLTDLSIGEYSVGLAPARTSEQLVLAYLELISLVRQDHPEYLLDNRTLARARASPITRGLTLCYGGWRDRFWLECSSAPCAATVEERRSVSPV